MALNISRHPLATHTVSILRDKTTDPQHFRSAARVLSTILAIEATSRIKLKPGTVQTPLEETQVAYLATGIAVVPVLRAGLSMLETFLDLFPDVAVGYIGLERDENAIASEYYVKLPEMSRRAVFVADPMLATGGTAVQAITLVKEAGYHSVSLVSVLATPEGVDQVQKHHPDVEIFAAALDRELDPNKFILPGLGDYGDRLYGTDEV